MFERFLHGSSNANPTEGTHPATPRPAPVAPPAQAQKPAATEVPAAVSEAHQEPLPEVRSEPMADSLNPSARPPMAHHPIQMDDLPSENGQQEPTDGAEDVEGFDEEEMDVAASDEEIEEDNPETALPVEEEPEMPEERPQPPSFLKEPGTESEQPKMDVSNSSYFVNEEEEEASKKKKTVVQHSVLGAGKETKVVRGASLHEVNFADIWFTPEGIAYVQDKSTYFALTPIETDDLSDFHRALEQGYTGVASYAVKFGGDTYRVERVNTLDGLQYNCRKMPTTTPEIETLGFAPPIVKHLTSLSRAAGLLLFAGPTGQGKTTTASALMKRFLDKDGGFLYTIEDPPEMPLSGIYHAQNGGLGMCKQVPVENDQWGAGLRSALRSRPRYILVGEIRTPETASQCLVAATSGHLVLSTIHASGVEDALNSMIKYAASTGLAESLVADLLARGILGVIHQRLEGTEKLRLIYQTAFANPNTNAADQMRMTIRDKNINLATFMEQQKARMDRGLPMFRD